MRQEFTTDGFQSQDSGSLTSELAPAKLLYLVPFMNLQSTSSLGVKRKILGQVEAFRSNGLDVEIIDSMDRVPLPAWLELELPFIVRLLRLPFKRLYQYWHTSAYKKRALADMYAKVSSQDSTIIYFRQAFLSTRLLLFHLQLRKLPTVRSIYLEVPTWPYDNEPFAPLADRFLRPFLRFAVDRVVTFSDVSTLFGVPTLQITNGVSAHDTPMANHNEKVIDRLCIVSTASMNPWVGIDRLLNGLHDYLERGEPACEISVVIAGSGHFESEWQALCSLLGLDDRVRYHGDVSGSDLDDLFSEADLAIGNLANHRRLLSHNADLKNREYCMRGLPFVISGADPAFPENFPFILRVPANDTPLDFEKVIQFYQELSRRHPEYPHQMRRFALENFDWNVVLRPVIMDMKKNSPNFEQHKSNGVME